MKEAFPLVAVDIGNARVKLGIFAVPPAEALPEPIRAVGLDLDCSDEQLTGWLPHAAPDCTWWISSVNRPVTQRVVESLKRAGASRVHVLVHSDLPIAIELPHPDRVGVDRLVGALAARALVGTSRAAIVVSMGTAITVNLVTPQGAFAGGAILPGLTMAARALHEFTDLLPLVEIAEPAGMVGTATTEAIQSGVYWGAVGAVRELITRLLAQYPGAGIFLTGGDARSVAAHLDGISPTFLPNLVLSGIALAAMASKSSP